MLKKRLRLKGLTVHEKPFTCGHGLSESWTAVSRWHVSWPGMIILCFAMCTKERASHAPLTNMSLGTTMNLMLLRRLLQRYRGQAQQRWATRCNTDHHRAVLAPRCSCHFGAVRELSGTQQSSAGVSGWQTPVC